MNKQKVENIENLLTKTSEAENTLLVKRNKGLAKNLRKFVKLKRKIATIQQS
ncbi:MAG: hypothetical protein J6C13_02745 [Clostridia bacterium]|nr:hypothetical protein [Clostridia bacterium]